MSATCFRIVKSLAKWAMLSALALLVNAAIWHGGFNYEFRRALVLNLKSAEVNQAILYYQAAGLKSGDITQKQLNDYIESHR